MILLISYFICIVIILGLMILTEPSEEFTKKDFLIVCTISSLSLFGVSTFAIFIKNDFVLEKDTKIKEKIEYIYSLNDKSNVINNFIIGSYSFKSNHRYIYYIKNEDGSKERKEINSDNVKIYEGNYEKPYYKETICEYGAKYNIKLGYFEDKKDCEPKKQLFVPEKTIISEYKLNN